MTLHLVLIACVVESITLKPFLSHEFCSGIFAVNSGEATNPNTQEQSKDLALVSVAEAKTSPIIPSKSC